MVAAAEDDVPAPHHAERPAPAAEPEPAVEDRELAVLAELAREADARVAFQGLRRRLGLHQEALSRTLRRLNGDGLVARDEKGYRLTARGAAAVRERARPAAVARQALTVVQALLPPGVTPDDIAERLAGRWFRGLHWYGDSETPDGAVLTWLADEGHSRVHVRVSGASMTLEVEVPRGERRRVFAAARGVLAALAEVYGLVPAEDSPLETLSEGRASAA